MNKEKLKKKEQQQQTTKLGTIIYYIDLTNDKKMRIKNYEATTTKTIIYTSSKKNINQYLICKYCN